MAAKERCVEVVHLGGDQFEMVENGCPTQTLVFEKTHDRIDGKKMKKSDHYSITFFLDEAGPFRFADGKRSVMWINKGTETHLPECPTCETHQPGEFVVTDRSDHSITVRNNDSDKCLYKFVLNLVDRNGNPVAYDPISENRNGGI
jgi:hypothetical protein